MAKTPEQMVYEASEHLDVLMSHADVKFLAGQIPFDVPWDEEGMEFVNGMVLGWGACNDYRR